MDSVAPKRPSEREESRSTSPSSEPRSPSPDISKKRKRNAAPTEELEINVNLPEPPSRRERRKAKKAKLQKESGGEKDIKSKHSEASAEDDSTKTARSEHGIWIGNLPWTATKFALRTFLAEQTGRDEAQITRVHMPAPKDTGAHKRVKPLNKGFAYVDFASAEAAADALLVSEALLNGRPVLIKPAKSFVGRPESHGVTGSTTQNVLAKGADGVTAPVSEKPPNKRVFVGNLGYEVTKEDLESHYSKCGDIENLHMATFQDSGKCKGFAWVTFVDLQAATDAVKGSTMIPINDDSDSEGSDDEAEDGGEKRKPKKSKMKKWFVNRLQGRTLRCEFAEDSTTRYKKRFSNKNAEENGENDGDRSSRRRASPTYEPMGSSEAVEAQAERSRTNSFKKSKDVVKSATSKVSTSRASGAIVEGKGKKITFD